MMKTICCNFNFEYEINSPIRERAEAKETIYHCVVCGTDFKTDDVKIIIEEAIFDPFSIC